ncbi:MAG: 50S ribosomal protein L7Ae [Candidatus Marsarchaeota archaeon]|nr:50S ribosomal protein L7Ae [Candidatus Marsarchaeota archaeon]MCL5112636.1 50S ribosomal protein L7Ae [Candidatus Marsarchaeota archaeon]
MATFAKFEVSDEVVQKTYEALQQARQKGTIRKGANEATKSVERGMAKFVVVATDVIPQEVVMHIPILCEQKGIPFTYVPSKTDLGKSIGMSVSCAAVAVENEGEAKASIAEVVSKITGIAAPKKEEKKSEGAEQKAEKKEKKPKKAKAEKAEAPAAPTVPAEGAKAEAPAEAHAEAEPKSE